MVLRSCSQLEEAVVQMVRLISVVVLAKSLSMFSSRHLCKLPPESTNNNVCSTRRSAFIVQRIAGENTL